MLYNQELKGQNIILRMVEFDDCNSKYLCWLNDKEVNQYLETRWSEQSIDTIKDFVKSIRDSYHSYLFAIIYQNKHIGNIKIGPIHPIYKFADISFFIGEKSTWGKGIATEAIRLISDFAFNILGLNRIQAGAFEQNIGSQKALENNGFQKEATFRKKYFLKIGDDFVNIYEYGLLKDDNQTYRPCKK